jgi:hypothetical protein
MVSILWEEGMQIVDITVIMCAQNVRDQKFVRNIKEGLVCQHRFTLKTIQRGRFQTAKLMFATGGHKAGFKLYLFVAG